MALMFYDLYTDEKCTKKYKNAISNIQISKGRYRTYIGGISVEGELGVRKLPSSLLNENFYELTLGNSKLYYKLSFYDNFIFRWKQGIHFLQQIHNIIIILTYIISVITLVK